MRRLVLAALLLVCTGDAPAGVHYSGERFAELPSQWRGFLTDLRTLRNVAVRPTPQLPASPLRQQYEEEVKKLREIADTRRLTIDEQADLGALLIRLGDPAAAVEVLRAAQREHPRHYTVSANLGAAWHLVGDLEQAAQCLSLAVQLAPGRLEKAEELHLRLVLARRRQPPNSHELDNLFGVKFVGESGKFEPGKLAEAERKKLPANAVALVQQLALWLPGDLRLLWQLAELANAHGDPAAAAEIYEICVGQFGLNAPDLRERRAAVRAYLAELAKKPLLGPEKAKLEHQGHAGMIVPKSRRPLSVKAFDQASLPPITKDGVNPLPWGLLLETRMGGTFNPAFPKYLSELDGHLVSINGFMQPLTDDFELNAFMLIEYPTGCWYCEMPEVTAIALVQLPEGKTIQYSRNLVKITGRLHLNRTDPEDFLYTLRDAKVTEVD